MNKTHRDIRIRVDNASGTLADISAYVNQQSLQRAIGLLDDTGLGNEESTFTPGLGSVKIALNGFVNTTTEAIFGPLISDNTSATKTVEFRAFANRFYNGETWVTDIQISGSKDSLETWSANFNFTGAANRTSVALA
jgi:hypothetical protein